MKTRILHILWEGIGGAEMLVAYLTKHLDLRKYDVSVAIMSKGGATTGLIDKKRIRVVEFSCSSGMDVLSFRKFYAFLRSNTYDIVINHQRSFLVTLGLVTINPPPLLIYHEHGGQLISGSIKTLLFYKLFRRYYDMFITLNTYMGQILKRKARLNADRIMILENPVDCMIFKPNIMNNRIDIDAKRQFVVGTVARIDPNKDLPLFIKTAKILVKRRKDIRFVIVGDGPLMDKIEIDIENAQLKQIIHLVGQTMDVAAHLRSFTLFLFTSLFEAFGLTILEALACEIPVVAVLPKAGGAIDLLRCLPGVFIVKDRCPESLADAIEKLVENRDRLREMGSDGRKYVVSNYSLENWIFEIEILYEKMLKKKRQLGRKRI